MTKTNFFGGGRPSGNKRRRYNQPRGPRRNHRIRASRIRVIGPNGTQIGVMSSQEALTLAKSNGLDLVEISPTARPPVCKILDFGKYMYQEGKKTKQTKATTVTSKLKEVKFRVNIDTHDYETKMRRAEEFLSKGHKVKLTLHFRGRELSQKDRGFELVKKSIEDLSGMGATDAEPRLVGRNLGVVISPLPEDQRNPKFYIENEDSDVQE